MKYGIFILVVMMIFLILPKMSFSEDCGNYEENIYWQTRTMVFENDRIWASANTSHWNFSLVSESVVVVTDISDPGQAFVATSFVLPFVASSIYVKEDLLLASSYYGDVVTVDISNPLLAVVRDISTIDYGIRHIFLAGNQAWIITDNKDLFILDTTLAANLAVLGQWHFEAHAIRSLECGGLAYVCTGDGLSIMDFSNPLNPVLVNHYPAIDWDVELAGNILVVSGEYKISTFDVSNPEVLVPLETMETEWYASNLTANENMVAVMGGYEGLVHLFTVNEAGTMEFNAAIVISRYYTEIVSLSKDYIYLISNYYLDIISMGNKSVMPETSSQPAPGTVSDMVVRDGYGFAAVEENGLCVFDLSDPENPQLVGSGFTPHGVSNIALHGDQAVLTGDYCISILNISDPTLPEFLGSGCGFDLSRSGGLALHNQMAWVVNQYGLLTAIDFSDPLNMFIVSTGTIEAVNLFINQGLLHTANREGLYKVYSLEVLPPQELGSLQVPYGCEDLVAEGDFVLIGSGYLGASLLDITDPGNPVLADFISVLGGVAHVTLNGNQAVVSINESTHILNISEDKKFQPIGTIWNGGVGHNVLAGGEILVRNSSNYYDGFSSFDIYPAPCSLPTPAPDPINPANGNLSIYPNPFNPRTTVSFNLQQASKINLRVYDLTGRLVKNLITGEVVGPGQHSWSWNGRDMDGRTVSSGIYLVQLQGDNFEASGRMALIR